MSRHDVDLSAMSLDELTASKAAIDGEIAARAGKPIEIRSRGFGREPPRTGFLLHVDWAVDDQSYVEWYPSEEAARAALLRMAERHGRVVDAAEGHWPSVDLTSPGCHTSRAWITPVSAARVA